jgi:protein LSM14
VQVGPAALFENDSFFTVSARSLCLSHRYLFFLSGSKISLVSKKNIRYEGTLYSINESDATVALQNVKSYGTEGREKTDEGCTFVPPQDDVHPYLLFRGQDIKDLHVHEKTEKPPAASIEDEVPEVKEPEVVEKPVAPAKQETKTEAPRPKQDTKKKERRPSRNNSMTAQVGTGASLLNRKARGTVDGGKSVCVR